jgi:DNA-binding transcriptional ArsR family regulator
MVTSANNILYNIFMPANILPGASPEISISKLFSLIGEPARIQILLVIADQAACVCHLEAVTGIRQASISQHLMVLRKAGLVSTNRAGRNIYYRLERPEVMAVLQSAAQLSGLDPDALRALARRPVAGCPCPQCDPASGSCKNIPA